jgi:hypothetical protein
MGRTLHVARSVLRTLAVARSRRATGAGATFSPRIESVRARRRAETSGSRAFEFAATVRRRTAGRTVAGTVAIGPRSAGSVVIGTFVSRAIALGTIGAFLSLGSAVSAEQQGDRGRCPACSASEKCSSHRFVFLLEREG